MKVAQLLGLWGPWPCQVCRDMDCLRSRSYGPIRVFFPASCTWRSEGLFGQSFSAAPPVQALRGLPCLESFSVVQRIRYIEGAPRLGSYSVDRRVRHLKKHHGVHQAFDGPASVVPLPMLASCGREAVVMAPPTTCDSSISLFPWLPSFPPQSFPATISSLTAP